MSGMTLTSLHGCIDGVFSRNTLIIAFNERMIEKNKKLRMACELALDLYKHQAHFLEKLIFIKRK
ncbi:MAG: hypothetical protein A3E53_02780 [Gammaproteobacteria bacterium RIFCSPHIGHO2_12_FULL_39_24]|nr:MAG: hypothetical protein A3E53_02780 [Gammaproteobacteria bacterium RIFCSPHIGHO2_12_FULL_39_24]